MIESTLTERFQTTIPKGVRDALGLRRGDRLAYRMEGDRVVLAKAEAGEVGDDPALGPFLDLIERDLQARPHAVGPLTESYVGELRELVSGVEVNLDASLDEEG